MWPWGPSAPPRFLPTRGGSQAKADVAKTNKQNGRTALMAAALAGCARAPGCGRIRRGILCVGGISPPPRGPGGGDIVQQLLSHGAKRPGPPDRRRMAIGGGVCLSQWIPAAPIARPLTSARPFPSSVPLASAWSVHPPLPADPGSRPPSPPPCPRDARDHRGCTAYFHADTQVADLFASPHLARRAPPPPKEGRGRRSLSRADRFCHRVDEMWATGVKPKSPLTYAVPLLHPPSGQEDPGVRVWPQTSIGLSRPF